jgi:hypothetical protein
MENVKELFCDITGKEIIIIIKEDKEELRKK